MDLSLGVKLSLECTQKWKKKPVSKGDDLLERWLPEERLSAILGLCKRHFCADRK